MKSSASADLIVIGTFVRSEEYAFDYSKDEYFKNRTNNALSGVVSTLRVSAVLAGNEKDDETEVVHVRWTESAMVLTSIRLMNCYREVEIPTFVYINKEVGDNPPGMGDQLGTKKIEPVYLMLLKREQNEGRYKPVTRQRFARDSFRVLNVTPSNILKSGFGI